MSGIPPESPESLQSLISLIKGLGSDIRAFKKEQQNHNQELQNQGEKLNQELQNQGEKLNQELQNQGEKLNVLVSQIHPLIGSVAALTEDSLRIKAAGLFGGSFCRHFLVRNIRDLVHLLTKAHFHTLMPDMVESRIAAGDKMARALTDAVLPFVLALLRFIEKFIPENSAILSTYRDAEYCLLITENIPKGVGILIQIASKLKRQQWTFVLHRLKKGLSGDLNELQSCDGPGILLADLMTQAECWREKSTYEGLDYVDAFLQTVPDPFVAFSKELEFDMRGVISLSPPHVSIVVGEIKSSEQQCSSASLQLARRSRILHWAVQTVFPGLFQAKTLVGRIFLQRRLGQTSAAPPRMYEDVSIYVHRL
jgi:hypothetical protein